jgi:hypothetical protein
MKCSILRARAAGPAAEAGSLVMTTAYAADKWANFGLAAAGTAATLARLLFVAISINLTRILEYPNLPACAGRR